MIELLATMTEEEAKARLRLIELDNPNAAPSYAMRSSGNNPIVEPVDETVVEKPVNPNEYAVGEVPVTAGLVNTLRGLGRGAIDATIDAPQMFSDIVGSGASFLGEALYDAPNDAASLANITNPGGTNLLPMTLMALGDKLSNVGERTKPSEAPFIDKPLDFISKEDPNIPKDSYWNAPRKGAEWGVGGLPNALRKTARVLPDIAMGLGATAGAAIDTGLRKNTEIDTPFGEIVGGIGGLLATIKGKPRAIDESGQEIPQAVLRALKYMDQNSVDTSNMSKIDAEKAQAAAREQNFAAVSLSLSEGEKGTLADILRTKEISNIESSLAGNASTRQNLREKNQEQLDQVAEEVRNKSQSTGVPEASRASAEREVIGLTQAIEANAVQKQIDIANSRTQEFDDISALEASSNQRATAAANEREAARIASRDSEALLKTDSRVDETAVSVQDEILAQQEAYRANIETPAYARFKNDSSNIPMETIGSAINRFRNRLEETEIAYFDRKFKSDINLIDLNAETISPDSFITYLSELRKARKNASSGDNAASSPTLRRMDELIEEIELSVTSNSPLYREAKATTTEFYRRFGDTTLQKALAGEPEYFTRNMGGLADESGAVVPRILKNTGISTTPQMVFEQLSSVARKEGIDNKFLVKYGAAIADLSKEQQALFRNAANDAENLKRLETDVPVKLKAEDNIATQLGKDETKLTKALEDEAQIVATETKGLTNSVQASLLGRYVDKPEVLLRELTSADNVTGNIRNLKELNKRMIEQNQGASFRADVTRYAQEALLKNDKQVRRILEESNILTKTELDNIERSTNKLKSIELRKNAVSSHLTPDKKGESWWNDLVKTGVVITAVKASPGGNELIIAGAMRRAVNRIFSKNPDGAEIAALEEFFLNPQLYIDAIRKARNAEEITTAFISRINAMASTARAQERYQQNN